MIRLNMSNNLFMDVPPFITDLALRAVKEVIFRKQISVQ